MDPFDHYQLQRELIMGHHGARFCGFRHLSTDLLVYCLLTTPLKAYNLFDDNRKQLSSFFESSLENTLCKSCLLLRTQFLWANNYQGAVSRALCPSGYYITPDTFTKKVAPPYHCCSCGHVVQSFVRSVSWVFIGEAMSN